MDRLIDEMSKQVIEDCVDRNFIKDTKAGDRRHLKSSPGNFSIFIKEKNLQLACVRAQVLQGIPMEGWLQDINNLSDRTPREQDV